MLVVEDHEDTREMMAWAMRASGCVVEVASTAEDAFLTAVLFAPDVIVMDIHLPTMSGVEAIRRFKSAEATREVAIVVCTAYGSAPMKAVAREAGCDGFLAKPVDPDVLLRFVEAQVSRLPGPE